MLFAPTALETAITPLEIEKAIGQCQYGKALNMALLLGDREVLKGALDAVPETSIDLVQKTIEIRSLHVLMRFLAEEIVSNYSFTRTNKNK